MSYAARVNEIYENENVAELDVLKEEIIDELYGLGFNGVAEKLEDGWQCFSALDLLDEGIRDLRETEPEWYAEGHESLEDIKDALYSMW